MLVDLSILKNEHFTERCGEPFHAHLSEDATIELRLKDAVEWAPPEVLQDVENGRRNRIPFKLEFTGPLAPVLSQQMYRLHNEKLGSLVMFLVPVARTTDAMRYEAVFT